MMIIFIIIALMLGVSIEKSREIKSKYPLGKKIFFYIIYIIILFFLSKLFGIGKN